MKDLFCFSLYELALKTKNESSSSHSHDITDTFIIGLAHHLDVSSIITFFSPKILNVVAFRGHCLRKPHTVSLVTWISNGLWVRMDLLALESRE